MGVPRPRALSLLGLTEDEAADPDTLRGAYRRRLRQLHPDLNHSPGAATATHELTEAYRTLAAEPGEESTGPRRPAEPPRSRETRRGRQGPATAGRSLAVSVLDDSSILVRADRETTFSAVLEAANELGNIGYLDPSAHLLEVIVEFLEAPTSSIVVSLQGRAEGTELFCSVEPLSGGESPPLAAVTALVARTLGELSLPPTRRGG